MLEAMLGKLQSQDNSIRNSAEQELENFWIATQPEQLLLGLGQVTSFHNDPHLRSFAAILLRRYCLKVPNTGENTSTLLEITGQNCLDQIRSNLIHSLQNEEALNVRNKVSDTASQIALFLVNKKVEWPELFQACMTFLKSPSPVLRKTTFSIFQGCPQLLLKQDQNSVKQMLIAGIQDADYEVQIMALKASIDYILIAKAAVRNGLADMLPLILNVIPPIMADPTKESDSVEGLLSIIDLAAGHPKMFKPIIAETVQFMLTQMKNEGLEDGTRQTCLELLMTLCEGAPGLMRKHEPFAINAIPIILNWMAELEDEADWYVGETIEDENESSNETAGEQAMDRIALYLGGNIVLPITFTLIPQLLSSPDWQRRHAALRCISAIGEGCHKFMSQELSKVVNLILPHLRDPHPRVRHAALNAIGQMCTDFSPAIQNGHHQAILSGMVPLLDDLQNIRVANYASAALVNFSETASKELLAPYIGTIIEKLLVLLNTGKLFCQEQAITTMATVADSAGPEFKKYYNSIMPVLSQILQLPPQKEVRSLKGKTLECASLVILAVGKEVFAPDAVMFITQLQTIQQSVTDSDDPQATYLLSAWARVCKVLGKDFAPYLEVVLPPLMKTAGHQAKMVAFEEGDVIGEEYGEDNGWELMALGDKSIAINTSLIDDKCMAVEMLLCYAQEMGELFHPYVQPLLELVTPLLKFYLNDGVRCAASNVIPVLLQCWIKANFPSENIKSAWAVVSAQLVEVIKEEDDIGNLSSFYACFGECIKTLGTSSLTPQHMQDLTVHFMEQLEQHYVRVLERVKQRQSPDWEAEDEDALQEQEYDDDALLSDFANLISTIFKVYGQAYLPYFERLLPKLVEFLDTSSRQWAMCVLCDVIEFTGPRSYQYSEHFLQHMGEGLMDSSPDVRQASCYGVGVAAKFGGQSYFPFCLASIPHLFHLLKQPDSRSEDNVMATENAISAVGKVITTLKDQAQFDWNTTIVQWIASLPLLEDAEEAVDTYTLLLQLIASNHPAVAQTSQIPKLVSILVQVLMVPSLMPKNDDILQQMLVCLRSIVAGSDGATKQAVWACLTSEQQQYLLKQNLA